MYCVGHWYRLSPPQQAPKWLRKLTGEYVQLARLEALSGAEEDGARIVIQGNPLHPWVPLSYLQECPTVPALYVLAQDALGMMWEHGQDPGVRPEEFARTVQAADLTAKGYGDQVRDWLGYLWQEV